MSDPFNIQELSRSSSEDVADFVTDSVVGESEDTGKGPGDGRGSSHGSKTSALVTGIDAYSGGGFVERMDSTVHPPNECPTSTTFSVHTDPLPEFCNHPFLSRSTSSMVSSSKVGSFCMNRQNA